MVSINLDDLNKNLDTAKSQLKNLDFKNLDWEKTISGLDVMDNLDWDKKISGLDVMDNLDTLKKLISTLRTFSISISIGLNCRYP